jgi:serine/threonine protein kinase
MAERYGQLLTRGEIGRGATSVVYRVIEEGKEGQGEYALKRFLNPRRLGRLKNEIAAYQRLSHPNIARICGHDVEGGKPYVVTEYCQGGELTQERLREKGLLDRLKLFLPVCQAVGYAHSQGIVHRDLKPSNILLNSDNTPVVADFGLCYLGGDERVTEEGEAVGPRFFIAPELESGDLVDVQPYSDVYSLGKLLYWLLTGRTFLREKHREPGYDLTKRDPPDSAHFFVYKVLDRSIVEDPARRIINGNRFADEVEEVIWLIESGAHVVNLRVPQLCSYCRRGKYQYRSLYSTDGNRPIGAWQSKDNLLSLFGWVPTGMTSRFFLFVCDHCGHVQMFRPDLTTNKDVWEEQ